MRATLTFDLPEELEDFLAALRGARYKSLLAEVSRHCRARAKHGDDPEKVKAVYQEIRNFIFAVVGDPEGEERDAQDVKGPGNSPSSGR